MKTMISIKNIRFGYDRQVLFSDFSLDIHESEFFSVIGPNGSGKSTLLKIILGLLKPSHGSIAIDGKPIARLGRKAMAKIASGVLQDFNPAYSFTVEEIVGMGRTPYSRLFSDFSLEDKKHIEKALQETGLYEMREKPFEQLSSGEKQRVLVAKCFAQNTPVLLLDECVAHLDPGHVQQILEVVREKNRKEKTTIVAVFHDINLASLYSDRIGVLYEGRLLTCGTPGETVHQGLLREVYQAEGAVLTHPNYPLPQILLDRKTINEETHRRE
jgi:iron complex transport system ATP-binding protein